MSNLKSRDIPIAVTGKDRNLALVALEVLQKAGCAVDAVSFHEAAQRRRVAVAGRIRWTREQALRSMQKAGYKIEIREGVLTVLESNA